MTDTTAEITPSTRDLVQFVSPNPSETSTIMQIEITLDVSEMSENLKKNLQTWEDQEISALIIDCQSRANGPIHSLKKIQKILTCPILKKQDIQKQTDLTETRKMGFDGQITTISHLSDVDYVDFYNLAQGMHFRLIPCIQNPNDWEKAILANPKFIYIDEHVGENLPPELLRSGIWLIGKKELKSKYPLKCIVMS